MRWLDEEVSFLKSHYEKFGLKYCSDKLNRNKKSVQSKSRKLNLKCIKNHFYMSDEFKDIIKSSNSLSDVCSKMNLVKSYGNRKTIKKYIKLNNLDMSHFHIIKHKVSGKKNKLDDILIENSTYSNNNNLKERLYKEGIKERKCVLCGQNEYWNNMKISLILDHINGINDDNRIENLRIVCPNCNAGLDTFSGKNMKKMNNSNFYTRKEIEINNDIYKNDKDITNIKDVVDIKNINRCECGSSIYNGSKKCVKCNNISQRKVERPTLELLKIDVTELGFEGTGRKFKVTGNCIKKWIRLYEKETV
jgi:hypothetical protein